MSRDWTLLLVLDAVLLAGAALALVGLVLRELRRDRRAASRERNHGGAPERTEQEIKRGGELPPSRLD